MSCGTKQRGDFSPRSETWSRQSNLLPSKWDPFPELKGPSCFPDCSQDYTENYSCHGCNYNTKKSAYTDPGLSPYKFSFYNNEKLPAYADSVEHYGCTGCATYSKNGVGCNRMNIGPAHMQIAVGNMRYTENYVQDTRGCCPQGYRNLGHTWDSQKPYTLG